MGGSPYRPVKIKKVERFFPSLCPFRLALAAPTRLSRPPWMAKQSTGKTKWCYQTAKRFRGLLRADVHHRDLLGLTAFLDARGCAVSGSRLWMSATWYVTEGWRTLALARAYSPRPRSVRVPVTLTVRQRLSTLCARGHEEDPRIQEHLICDRALSFPFLPLFPSSPLPPPNDARSRRDAMDIESLLDPRAMDIASVLNHRASPSRPRGKASGSRHHPETRDKRQASPNQPSPQSSAKRQHLAHAHGTDPLYLVLERIVKLLHDSDVADGWKDSIWLPLLHARSNLTGYDDESAAAEAEKREKTVTEELTKLEGMLRLPAQHQGSAIQSGLVVSIALPYT